MYGRSEGGPWEEIPIKRFGPRPASVACWSDQAKDDWWGYGSNEHPPPPANAEITFSVRLRLTGTVSPWADLAELGEVAIRAPMEWAAQIARLLNETSGLHLDGEDTHTLFAMDRAEVRGDPVHIEVKS